MDVALGQGSPRVTACVGMGAVWGSGCTVGGGEQAEQRGPRGVGVPCT